MITKETFAKNAFLSSRVVLRTVLQQILNVDDNTKELELFHQKLVLDCLKNGPYAVSSIHIARNCLLVYVFQPIETSY